MSMKEFISLKRLETEIITDEKSSWQLIKKGNKISNCALKYIEVASKEIKGLKVLFANDADTKDVHFRKNNTNIANWYECTF